MDNNKKEIKYTWLRQLLTSILGTAIGVGLTFTVNRCMDSRKQQDVQRETAIMAVCDIDEIAQGLMDVDNRRNAPHRFEAQDFHVIK